MGGAIVAPSTPTCGDRAIDFFVIAECFSHAAPKAYTIGEGSFYPHRPVRLLIRAKARVEVVRQLKVSAGFGAVLPLGSPIKPRDASGESHMQVEAKVGRCKDYRGLITTIEKELSCIKELNETEAAPRSGRSKGVSYCWKNPPTGGSDSG